MSNDLGKRNDFPEYVWKQDGKVFERFGRHYVERNSEDFDGKNTLVYIVFVIGFMILLYFGLSFLNGDFKQGKPVSREEHRKAIKEYIQNRNKPGCYDAGWENHRCENCKDLW